jgi:carbon monoxide dehydrogenase subunit G
VKLDNEFVVPRPVEQAWAVLTDVERIAPCMPGAQLGEIDGDNYHGTVKVKVGPVVAQYAGVARFRELDAASHHAVLEANGKQKGGTGRAAAVVTADLTSEGESTRVKVSTDLTIAGPLAQFGRGAMAEVSGRLLNQFVDRLKETVLAEDERLATAAAEAGTAPTTAPTQPLAASPAEPGDSATAADAPSTEPAASQPGLAGHGTEPVAGPGGVASAPGVASSMGTGPAQATAPSPGTAPASRPKPAAVEVAPADLLQVAGLPILKRLIPLLVVIAVIVVVLVIWLG